MARFPSSTPAVPPDALRRPPAALLGLTVAMVATLLLGDLVLPFSVAAHPGPVGLDGCHVVACDYVDAYSGDLLPAGSRHCHVRTEDGLQLGGPPVRLRAPGEAEAPAPPCDAAPSAAPSRPEAGR